MKHCLHVLAAAIADFAREVATLVADGAATMLAFEQPENVGGMTHGPAALARDGKARSTKRCSVARAPC